MIGPVGPEGHRHHDVVPDGPEPPEERRAPVRRAAAAAAPGTEDWLDPSAWWAVAAAAVALTGLIGVAPALPAAVVATVLALTGTAVILHRIRHERTRPVLRSGVLTVTVALAIGIGTLLALMPPVPPSA